MTARGKKFLELLERQKRRRDSLGFVAIMVLSCHYFSTLLSSSSCSRMIVTAFSASQGPAVRRNRRERLFYPSQSQSSFFSARPAVAPENGDSYNNKEEGKSSLEELQEEIAKYNGGIAINVQSPKQVSMAIFGLSQSAAKHILQDATQDPTLSAQKRALAQLILQCRNVMKEESSSSSLSSSSLSVPSPRASVATASQRSFSSAADGLDETASGSVQEQNIRSSKQGEKKITSSEVRLTHEQMVDFLCNQPGSKVDEFWREPLNRVNRPVARDLFQQLDPSECPMAFDPTASPKRQRTAVSTTSTAGKKGSFLAFCREQKELYPQCIILTRMGDFYETFGLDAILLVEHASLNPMGGKAKAGCPYRNVQATLNALIEEGFSVAVYEEVGQTASNKLKTRVLSQIVSPASPTYLYDHNWLLGSDHDNSAALDQLPPSRPCVGIVHTAAGYHMVECSLEERSVEYSERLTSEAVACRLAAYPPAEPLVYIPSPTETSSSLPFLPQSSRPSTCAERELVETHLGGYRIRTVVLPPQLVPTTDGPESERYTHAIVDVLLQWNEKRHDDGHHELTSTSRRPGGSILEQRPTPKDFTISQTSTDTHPLYLESANQLGLLNDPSIPPLVASVLDEAAPAATRRFLKRYLLVPPPPHVAQAMSQVVDCLINDNGANVALPRLSVPPLGKILSLIRAGQASASIYGELLHTLAVTRYIVVPGQDILPVEELLTLCSHESGLVAERESLSNRCDEAMHAIETIICPSHHVEDEMLSNVPYMPTTEDPTANYRYLPDSFVEKNEMSWRGRVQRKVAAETYEAVESAGRRLDEAIARDFIRDDESNQALIAQDIFNNLLVLKKVPSGGSAGDYIHPRDRHGKKLSTRFSTQDVEQALCDYVSACDKACEEVSSILSSLAQTMQEEGHLVAIIQGAHLNLALSAAYHHAIKAIKQGWKLAGIIEPDKYSDEEQPNGKFVDLWPYWMPKHVAVPNTFELNGMFLLTAPNMSGKSTLMRSAAAAALLSVCGLCAPLSRDSKIPRFDTLFLRGASADVPAENKSAFGAEMEDMAALMRCCGPRSLVFVDEIGRGTSPRDGARLAAAILEAMSSRGMSGIFATHLHEILHLPLKGRERIISKRMAISKGSADEGGLYEWTYLLEEGICNDSLATVTAKRFGLPNEIIERADELGLLLPPSPTASNRTRPPATSSDEMKHEDSTSSRERQVPVDLESFQEVLSFVQDRTKLSAIPIPRKANPPPTVSNKSCLYVLELGYQPPRYYVGETDGIFQRLKTHRKKGPAWSNCRAAIIPVESKSEARRLESVIIQEMAQAGYLLESTTDGKTLRP